MQSPRPDLNAVLSSLTARERQIVDYVAAGRPNKVIAIDLGISLRTVEAHRARIFAKLDARNAMQLACRLCTHGRSGASPILGALKDGAGASPPNRPGSPAYMLHEPAPAFAPSQAPQGAPDPDAWPGVRPK
ncbi:LuxR C-terminal-related transcriptional regulator [Achromobacter sp. NPDC058515]|uniref:response regulator transcription factor n=1 Tax=Achromobacter sp. NPDC058515 TaxID=3346533 RepID=UPI00365BAD97